MVHIAIAELKKYAHIDFPVPKWDV